VRGEGGGGLALVDLPKTVYRATERIWKIKR
jgi:hypothetical protein